MPQSELDELLESVACAVMLAGLTLGAVVGIALAHLARWGGA